jgi:hypothetical protein
VNGEKPPGECPVRFASEVVAARWDETAARWQVRVRSRDGGEETLTANARISAGGQLNRPRLPDIPGRDSFAGPASTRPNGSTSMGSPASGSHACSANLCSLCATDARNLVPPR